jgi:hypothetical protein
VGTLHRTSGSAGGPRKRISRKADTAPRADPTSSGSTKKSNAAPASSASSRTTQPSSASPARSWPTSTTNGKPRPPLPIRRLHGHALPRPRYSTRRCNQQRPVDTEDQPRSPLLSGTQPGSRGDDTGLGRHQGLREIVSALKVAHPQRGHLAIPDAGVAEKENHEPFAPRRISQRVELRVREEYLLPLAWHAGAARRLPDCA